MSGFQHDIAGGGGNLVITSFQSPNFAAGSSGWQVTKTGDAEFNSVTVRGEVEATEFSTTVTVSAGPYAGTYVIETGTLTDSSGNMLAVISWQNSSAPAYLTPYIAAVTGTGTGNITSIHSGQETSGDTDGSIWVLSAVANDGTNSLFLVDADHVQLFGSTGPTLFQNQSGFAVDTWHSMSFQNGWVNGASPNVQCQYRLTAENQVEIIGTVNGAGASAATFATLPTGYRPTHQQMVPCQDTAATSGNYYIQCSTGGVLSIEGTANTGPFVFHGYVSLDA